MNFWPRTLSKTKVLHPRKEASYWVRRVFLHGSFVLILSIRCTPCWQVEEWYVKMICSPSVSALMGHIITGAPIQLDPKADNQADAKDPNRVNDFDYLDSNGNISDQTACPFSAHLRKVCLWGIETKKERSLKLDFTD